MAGTESEQPGNQCDAQETTKSREQRKRERLQATPEGRERLRDKEQRKAERRKERLLATPEGREKLRETARRKAERRRQRLAEDPERARALAERKREREKARRESVISPKSSIKVILAATSPERHPQFPCLNCGQRLLTLTGSLLYCSDLCNQEAAYVRYSRAVFLDGRWDQPDVQEARKIRLSHILGGGYPETARMLPASERAAIFARDGGTCYLCGQPGNQIDHVGAGPNGDVNARENLRIVCDPCHRKKTIASFTVATKESDPERFAELDAKAMALDARIFAPEGERLCDDPERWAAEWRGVARERREAIRSLVALT